MIRTVCVNRIACQHPERVEAIGESGKCALARACARARSSEGSDGTVAGAHESIAHVKPIQIVARNLPLKIDVCGEGALAGAYSSALDVENSDHAVAGPYKSVVHTGTVGEVSRDCSGRADAQRICPIHVARCVERGHIAVHFAQKTVTVRCVTVVSRDRSCGADGEGVSALSRIDSCAGRVEADDRSLACLCIGCLTLRHKLNWYQQQSAHTRSQNPFQYLGFHVLSL